MTKLLRDNELFVWGIEQQHAFEQVKASVKGALILLPANQELQYYMKMDASGGVIRIVLEQKGLDGKL
jgi:hypothetical protein